MNFLINCNLPIKVGDWADRWKEFFPGDSSRGTSGELQIGGTERYIECLIGQGKIFEIEMSPLVPGDSFCGVDLSESPEQFKKLLSEKGIESTLNVDSLKLRDYPVSMYIDEDNLASICWSLPNESPTVQA